MHTRMCAFQFRVTVHCLCMYKSTLPLRMNKFTYNRSSVCVCERESLGGEVLARLLLHCASFPWLPSIRPTCKTSLGEIFFGRTFDLDALEKNGSKVKVGVFNPFSTIRAQLATYVYFHLYNAYCAALLASEVFWRRGISRSPTQFKYPTVGNFGEVLNLVILL